MTGFTRIVAATAAAFITTVYLENVLPREDYVLKTLSSPSFFGMLVILIVVVLKLLKKKK